MAKTTHETELNLAGKLAALFIHSKITLLIMLALFLAGMLALVLTPREYNPQIVVPAANIIVPKPGATPQEVENMVVKPLENIMNALPGVDHTYGMAMNDVGIVTVQFEVGEDQTKSLVNLYNQLMQHIDEIPPDTLQPIVKPINVDDVPIMTLAISSEHLSSFALRDVALKLVEHIRNIPDVSFTKVVGGKPRAINVWLDAQKIAMTGLTLDQIRDMLKGNNASLPVGELVNSNKAHPVRVSGYLKDVDQVGDIIIGVVQGRPIFLKDIARIVDGPMEIDQDTRIGFGPDGGKPNLHDEIPQVTITIAKKPGTNAVTVANRVLAKLEEMKRSVIPQGVEVVVTRNDGEKADDAVNTLVEHLGIAVGSVIIILMIFLGWREAGIVTLTVPLILFVVLVVGLVAGQTINRITLFALILSLGLLVDAAIVVIENIHRHIHEGFDPKRFDQVLIQATNEIGNPTNIATLAVILAFIPMLFVTGMMGPFMAPIPFNVPVAMIASLVIAYILVPYAVYHWMGKRAIAEMERRESLLEEHEQKEDWLQRGYRRWIEPLIESRIKRNVFFGITLVALILALLQPALPFLQKDMNGPLPPMGVEVKMLPYDNTNTLLVEVKMPEDAALEATDQVARTVGDVLRDTPFVTDYSTFLGMTAPVDFAALVRGDLLKKGPYLAQIRVNLVNKHHRDVSSHEIAQRLDKALDKVRAIFPEAELNIYETPPGPPVPKQILAELYGPDYDRLRAAAHEVNGLFKRIYGMINVNDTVTADVESYRIVIDRDQANLLGVAPAQVGKMLHDYVSGFKIGALHLDDVREPVHIVVRLPRSERSAPEQLMSLRVASRTGAAVPVSAVAKIEKIIQAKPIIDRDQNQMVMVGGELLKSSPVYAVLTLDKWLDGQTLPKSGVTFHTANLGFVEAQPKNITDYTLLWGGEMRLTLDVFRDMGSAFMVALVFIYLILVAYYRSFMIPVIVMGAIPLTMIGVFPGHWLTGQAFTATSMIGVIALAGIVVRNSLLLIDFILDYRKQGYGLKEAVVEAGKVRARPIILTALAIIFGSAIMITDPVFGGLAVALIFGTLSSTLLTLFIIPLLYYIWQLYFGDGDPQADPSELEKEMKQA